jgi:F0F1-type ATP synthase assembly protein I
MTTPSGGDRKPKYRQIKDIEPPADPLDGTPQEDPSGPFAPPPMPDVLKARQGDEPTRPVIVKPMNALHLGKVFAVGMDFVYAFIGATALGWVADWFFKSAPKGLLLGAGLGLVVGMYRFVKEGLRLMRPPHGRSGGPGT